MELSKLTTEELRRKHKELHDKIYELGGDKALIFETYPELSAELKRYSTEIVKRMMGGSDTWVITMEEIEANCEGC